ncbi:NAD(P)H-dependent oxidoreductase [Actinobaculum sp. 313]|uniref:NAD(P)H-dependent oxidoreductase n=1 Tax=Actinobaculum sp. 313 TaxID=2495645 RepID=UPI00196B080E|nr:NAD(P)H-dependent oxidoreductase [Actinobaculum sp. 313]
MMDNILVVYAHPYPQSFAHAVLDEAVRALEEKHADYNVIDLYADGFDPRYSAEELALFSQGRTLDPLVTQYQGLIEKATALVFISPIWWSDVPSIIKGFVEKVMKQKWAYESTGRGVKGKLGHIRRVKVFTTSTSPTFYLRLICGNAVGKVFLGASMKQLGIAKRDWVNLGQVASSADRRRAHLQRVYRDVSALCG